MVKMKFGVSSAEVNRLKRDAIEGYNLDGKHRKAKKFKLM